MLARRSLVVFICLIVAHARAQEPVGYYRSPALHGDTLVFLAEGDLWKVSLAGGTASRFTTHLGDETTPAISPDGTLLAFVGTYEGPAEVYVVPLSGGLPTRLTYEGSRCRVVGWTPDGHILYSTEVYSTLPNWQLVRLHPKTAERSVVPLAQASDGVYDETGRTLFFTRLPFQGSHTKRYKGGTAQNLWRFADGDAEATPLTADYPGTSKRAMWWQGRVYFASDRDGTMNLWSMRSDGGDLRQHTTHRGWDVIDPSQQGGRIVYQLGADIRVYDIASGQDRAVPITLAGDFDQTRERWVKKPMEYVTSVHVSPNGDRVVLTARGQVFVAPHRQGRLVEATRKQGVRYRDARFMPDGKALLTLSDESGEVELWTLPANGVGEAKQLTRDGAVLRWVAVPSPDGRYVAHHDKNQRLWLYDVQKQTNTRIEESPIDSYGQLVWSPDSKWLAFVATSGNLFRQVKLYGVENATITPVTSDRYDSYSPAWSPDGKWLYLVSDRNLESMVGNPWGTYQPEPFLGAKSKLYQIALRKGERSPFAPLDELNPEKHAKSDDSKSAQSQPSAAATAASATAPSQPASESAPASREGEKKPPAVTIDLDGLAERLIELPVPPGNYDDLTVIENGLLFTSKKVGEDARSLVGVPIAREHVEIKTVVAEIRSYELSQDGKKLLIRKGDNLYIVDAAVAPADLEKKDVRLGDWMLSVIPREEWRQMFIEAWRLERDYFYDPNMHGVDWKSMLAKYLPLVDRVSTRAELSDLIAQMVAELSALHTFVYGGDLRSGDDNVSPASLGATLTRDSAAGGWRVSHIYASDPDEPQRRSPLARPGADVREGDLIEQINGQPTAAEPDLGRLLRRTAGKQTLLRVRPADGGEPRDVIVTPMSQSEAADLRYHEWEYTRRLRVEQLSNGQIGYVHLRAMGGANYTEWARGFYPAFTRGGLIIDVRHNRGGNIDSWLIEKLMRKAWFFWSQRVGNPPSWNMQYAFRGHVVVLINERSASDGEAFPEGVKRNKLGTVIGTRTWGGEIWLSSNNFLVDRGIATAAEYGVYGPEGQWLIEGHGVEPDIVVDNLPHATFKGEDAQLQAAIDLLMKKIREQPVTQPTPPPHPDKSFK